MKVYCFICSLLILILFSCVKDKASSIPCPNWQAKTYNSSNNSTIISYGINEISGNNSNFYILEFSKSGASVYSSILRSNNENGPFNQINYGAHYQSGPGTITALEGDTALSLFWGTTSTKLLSTYDAGKTWSSTDLTSIVGTYLNVPPPIYFHNSKTGYVGMKQGLYFTKDAGNNWLIDSNLLNFDIYDITFINKNTGYLLANNMCLKTINGGLKWDTLYSSSYKLQKVIFTDSVNGFIKGKELLKTNDGGSTWNIIYSAEVRDFAVKDDKTIVAISKNNEILISNGNKMLAECKHTTYLSSVNYVNNLFYIGCGGVERVNTNPPEPYTQFYFLKEK